MRDQLDRGRDYPFLRDGPAQLEDARKRIAALEHRQRLLNEEMTVLVLAFALFVFVAVVVAL